VKILLLGGKAQLAFFFFPSKRKRDVGKQFSKLFLKCGMVMNQGLLAVEGITSWYNYM